MTDQHVIARLNAALELDDDPTMTGAALLPSRLARAAAATLAVDGASLSLMSLDIRIPLGASSPAATRAERLQFTLGEGPCLDVIHDGHPIRSGPDDMARTWPQFHRELTTTTPFRAVVAVPLPFTSEGDGGALDLYVVDPAAGDRVDLGACEQVADRMVDLLVRAVAPAALPAVDDAAQVSWLQAADARARMEVWVAIGILTARVGLDSADGLTMMRAWAHSNNSDVDRVAGQLVDGSLDPDLFRP